MNCLSSSSLATRPPKTTSGAKPPIKAQTGGKDPPPPTRSTPRYHRRRRAYLIRSEWEEEVYPLPRGRTLAPALGNDGPGQAIALEPPACSYLVAAAP